ncbi:hypothetical protein DdX_01356 [Ditylenchus destructor]|uniref:Uncharacterized protein n=1 Tax=Ditylenchus destructor TaxID=166010 RepID=A0AAD4NI10_9BILA|nr:hypothetical protein DdX_01356 [Ditylenchus destructor]
MKYRETNPREITSDWSLFSPREIALSILFGLLPAAVVLVKIKTPIVTEEPGRSESRGRIVKRIIEDIPSTNVPYNGVMTAVLLYREFFRAVDHCQSTNTGLASGTIQRDTYAFISPPSFILTSIHLSTRRIAHWSTPAAVAAAYLCINFSFRSFIVLSCSAPG